jgi:hypothetical protein
MDDGWSRQNLHVQKKMRFGRQVGPRLAQLLAHYEEQRGSTVGKQEHFGL